VASALWITPNRHTRLDLLIQAPVSLRPSWSTARKGGQITSATVGVHQTERVQLQSGGGWTLKPLNEDLSRILSGVGGGFGTTPVRATDGTLGTHWGEVETYRKPTDLTGLDPSADLQTTGSPTFYKKVPAGADWGDSHLSADAAAYPQPTLQSADIPMDRVFTGAVTYPQNTGFAIILRLPADFNQIDTLFTFYFGGPAESTPSGTHAGEFALTLRGSGKALLHEKQGDDWIERLTFNAYAGLQGNMALVSFRIWPYSRDLIALSGGSIDGQSVVAPFSGLTIGGPGIGAPQRFSTHYRNNPAVTGYRTKKSMTGAGTIRLDMRRDIRTYVQLIRLRPPEDGTLTDLPFWCPYPIPGDSIITVTGTTWRPPDTDVTVQLYDATTHAALLAVGGNRFETVAGQQAYFAKFTFAADPDQEQTPVLWDYRVDLAGTPALLAPVGQSVPVKGPISITGPDLDITHETASLTVQDPTNSFPVLRSRGRIPARLAVYDDSAALTTVLMDGEVNQAVGTKLGQAGRVYPSANWYRYDVTLVGVWARLAEAISLELVRFDVRGTPAFYRNTGDTAVDPQTGEPLAWKITDIIAYLLERLGYGADQVDIPDVPIRLFMDGRSDEEFMLQPTVSPAEFIKELGEKYLNMVLLWDPNAGASGMWRLLYNPTPATLQIRAAFVGGPGVAGRLPSHPNSYPANTAFIRSGSFREEVKAPECNFTLVVGADLTYPSQISYAMYNPTSFDFIGATSDPTHIDYLGRIVPIIHVDRTLMTREACRFVCRRIYGLAAHGELWFRWEGPALLITDALDPYQVNPRLLRINDGVTVFGIPCVIRSANFTAMHDAVQMCAYEAVRFVGA